MAAPILTRRGVLNIPRAELPMIVLSDNLFSWISLAIRKHTHGYYNHAMWMREPHLIASQDLMYHERPIYPYLETSRLKFIHNPAWSTEQRAIVWFEIEKKLRSSWWRRLYDFRGVLGQFLRLRWIQSPWREYCSENVGRILAMIEPDFTMRRPTPSDINIWSKAHHQMHVYGVYSPDEE